MTANLKAPIIINLKNRLAKQVILHQADYPIRKSIFAELQHHCAASQRTIFPETETPAYHTIRLADELDTNADRTA